MEIVEKLCGLGGRGHRKAIPARQAAGLPLRAILRSTGGRHQRGAIGRLARPPESSQRKPLPRRNSFGLAAYQPWGVRVKPPNAARPSAFGSSLWAKTVDASIGVVYVAKSLSHRHRAVAHCCPTRQAACSTLSTPVTNVHSGGEQGHGRVRSATTSATAGHRFDGPRHDHRSNSNQPLRRPQPPREPRQ